MTTTQATPRTALADEIRSWLGRRARVYAYWNATLAPAEYDAVLDDIHTILGPVAADLDMIDACTVAARVLRAFATAVPKASR